MNFKEKIAARIKQAREAAQLSQRDLAELGGYSRGRIGNWESGARLPGLADITQLAQLLKVSSAWLYCLSEEKLNFVTNFGEIKLLPIIGASELINLETAIANPLSKKVIAITQPFASYVSNLAFAILANDESMCPEIKPNDLLIIDPKIKPLSGSFILARQKASKNFLIRKYRTPEENIVELIAINPDWPKVKLSTNTDVEIIGTVLEIRGSTYSFN